MSRKKPNPVEPVADARIVERRGTASPTTVSLSALKEQEAGLRRAQDMANLAHVITKPDGSFESWSETLPRLIGVAPEDIVDSTRRWLDLIHPGDRDRFRETALRARAEGRRTDVEYRVWRGGEAWIHVRQVMEPIPGHADASGRLRWFNTLQDITPLKQAEERIGRLKHVHAVLSAMNSVLVRVRKRDELLNEVCELAVRHGSFRMAWIGLAHAPSGRIQRWVSAGLAPDFYSVDRLSLGEGDPDFGMCGSAVRSLKPVVCQDVQRDARIVAAHRTAYAGRGIGSLCVLPLVVRGRAVGVLALYAAEAGFFDEEEMRLLAELAGNISFALDSIESSERAEQLAYYDALTALANRSLFRERLAQKVELVRGEGRRFALIIADLERFKTINDSFGWRAGDELLVQVADRLGVAVEAGRAGRVGADVFACFVPDVSGESVARRIEELQAHLFATPYRIGEEELVVSARLGIALYPEDGADADTLYRNAEAALKKAKRSAERYLFYEQRMTERVAERLALEGQLRRALERDEFVLYYQPKVDLARREICGVEALIRWKSRQLGLVAPGMFVPLLEETGLILEVGFWALQQAARDQRALAQQGLATPRIAVNVSSVQLRQRNFVELVGRALDASAAPPGIDLEITESFIMDDIEANIEKLRALQELGLRVAVDDFGTGYSSLGYLARLPVQFLKIDRSFIHAMQGDANAMTLVSTMISLAHSLRLLVVAEGVETEAQATILGRLRCDELQGYLFGRPMPLEDLVSRLRAGEAPPA